MRHLRAAADPAGPAGARPAARGPAVRPAPARPAARRPHHVRRGHVRAQLPDHDRADGDPRLRRRCAGVRPADHGVRGRVAGRCAAVGPPGRPLRRRGRRCGSWSGWPPGSRCWRRWPGFAPTYATFFVLLDPDRAAGDLVRDVGEPVHAAGLRAADARPGDRAVHGHVHGRYARWARRSSAGWPRRPAPRWSLIGGGLITLVFIAVAAAVLRPRPSDEVEARAAYALHAPPVPVEQAEDALDDGFVEPAAYPVDGRARA